MIQPEWITHSEKISVNHLETWCTQQGIKVLTEVTMPKQATAWAFFSAQNRTIYLSRNLPHDWILPTLAHETFHAVNQHDGHQPKHIERRIDEQVAQALINPTEYAYWEQQYGWATGGIASAMEQPRWLIEAYRRRLSRLDPAFSPIPA